MSFESKFRNVVGRVEKLSKEDLVVVLRGLLNELNKEKNFKEKPNYIENDYFSEDPDWELVNGEMRRTKVRRYKWNKILGESLTKRTLKIRNKGLESNAAIDIILRSPGVISFLLRYPEEQDEFIRKLRIGVSSRYAENKTADNLRRKE